MGIAADRLPLLIYLLMLWPVLPGSMKVVVRFDPTLRKRKIGHVFTSIFAALILGFHIWLIFIGYFWDS